MCSKVPYPDKSAAIADRDWMRRHFRNRKHNTSAKDIGKATAYLCDKCGQWHLTSWSKSQIKNYAGRKTV